MAAKRWAIKSQADLAEACGVSLATIQHWARIGMPGKPGSYDFREVFQWSRTSGPCAHRKANKQEADPLLPDEDVDSPGLERYRQAKASLAELELEERKQSLIPIESIRTTLGQWASQLRSMGDVLGRDFGAEAQKIVNDTLDECERLIGTTDDSGPAAETNE